MRRYIIFIPIVLVSLAIIFALIPSNNDEKRALIIDGLSIDLPNEEFIEEAKMLLNDMGYEVDITKNATLELYKKLPSMNYDLIIFRTHGLILDLSIEEYNGLFTSEPYSTNKYTLEQLMGSVSRGRVFEKEYFVAKPIFVESAEGNFDDTIIILMACNSFTPTNENLPNVLMKKGAKMVIGWEGLVSITHVDDTVLKILRSMKNDGLDEIDDVIASIEDDPIYGGKINYIKR